MCCVEGIMSRVGILFLMVFVFLVASSYVQASTPALRVVTTEYVSQVIAYDQVIESGGQLIEAIGEEGENRTGISRTGVELKDTTITGFLNITNVETVGNHTLSSINVTINGTDDITSWYLLPPVPSYLMMNSSVDMSDPQGASEISFFISELRANDTLLVGFNVTPGSYGEPLNFTEQYSDWRVLTGRTVNVTLNVTNNFRDAVDIYDIVVQKTPQLYDYDLGPYTFFTYDDLRGLDSGNAGIFTDGYDRTVINWTPRGGTLSQYETAEIIFNSTAPTNISLDWASEDDWAKWMNMGNVSATFKIKGSISGLFIKNATAVSTAALSAVTKERINVSGFWNATANVSNIAKSPLDFELIQLSVWATRQGEYSDPGDTGTWVNDSTTIATSYGEMLGVFANATWFPKLNLSSGSSIGNYSIVFNYSYVPIVWMAADFMIYDDGQQIFRLNQSSSHPEDKYLFIEEIYVLLGGYLIKATKSIAPEESATGHRYFVNITLENIGTERTPDLITMFDLLPEDFNPLTFTGLDPGFRNMTSTSSLLRISDSSGDIDKRISGSDESDYIMGYADTGEIVTGPYQGYWGYNIDFSALDSGSDGDGRYTQSLSLSEILIRYRMYGNHSLARVENAYIVGVDPIRLEGARPSQSVASRLSIMSSAAEFVIIVCALVLSVAILAITFIIIKDESEVKK